MEAPRLGFTILHVVGFLDLLAVSLVVPSLPVHIKSLGFSATVSGLVTSIYGALQLFSSPLIGKWSDISSRENVMGVCLVATCAGYFLSSFHVNSLIFLAILRFIPGIFKHTQDLCRCCLIDGFKNGRNQVLGSFNAVSSIGFILGPPVHGHLVEIFGHERGMSMSFFLCSLLFMVNFCLIFYACNRYKHHHEASCSGDPSHRRNGFSNANGTSTENGFVPNGNQPPPAVEQDTSIFQRGIFASRFLSALAVMIFRSSFVLWLTHHHPNLAPSSVGYILSYNGALGLVFGFLVGLVSNLQFYKGKEEKLHLHATGMVLLSFFMVFLSQRLIVILVAMATLVMGTAVLRVNGLVLSVKYLKGSEIGKIQGLGSSVLSVARFAAPLSSGILLESWSSAPNLASLCLTFLAATIFFRDSYNFTRNIEKLKTQ